MGLDRREPVLALGGDGARGVSVMCNPGYGCLTCTRPYCNGAPEIPHTREEKEMRRCGRIDECNTEAKRKSAQAAATALSAKGNCITVIVSRTKGEMQYEVTQTNL